MAAESFVVAMKEPLGRGIRNQITRSRHSLFVGSLEDENDSLARILTLPRLMLHLERVSKGFISN
jgi:hypothetical protein